MALQADLTKRVPSGGKARNFWLTTVMNIIFAETGPTYIRLMMSYSMKSNAYPSLPQFFLSGYIGSVINAHTAEDPIHPLLFQPTLSNSYTARNISPIPTTTSSHNVRQIARRIEGQDLGRR
jgi:hypothetical protein